jgi:phosphate transport system substrate-binding protein
VQEAFVVVAQPGSALWHLRLTALAVLLALVVGAQALLAPHAGADGFVPISGSGSSWSSSALEQWRRAVIDRYDMAMSFSPDGSTTGRDEFRAGLVDFAVSEIPYGGSDGGMPDPLPARAFGYLPIVAGGTAFMYNLTIDGKRVTNLRLSGENLAKIFTQGITNWADPAIKTDNPGLALPARPIVPVVRSDAAGPTAQFTSYLASQYPAIWDRYCQRAGLARTPCGPSASYPMATGMQAKTGSLGVTGFVAQGVNEGAITYVEYSYARNAGFPVAKVLNAANYYVEPKAGNVAVALLNATLHPDLTQDLSQVYRDADPRAYPLSSYSYMIIPKATTESFTTDKGRTLAEFARYVLCDGQRYAEALGYAPLPVNLVQTALSQVNQIPGADHQVNPSVLWNCRNPALAADGTDLLVDTLPQPPPCDFKAALIQCATGTGGASAPTASTISLAVAPSIPSDSDPSASDPLAANTVQTLTATISPAGMVGSVQFKDGAANVGGPVTVASGIASTTTTLAPGVHSLTAVFTPADPAVASESRSAAVPVVVSVPAGAKATATTFMAIPSGPVIQGTPVILVAQVTPASAAGTIQFKDGDTELGLPRPVVGGLALTVTSKLTKGTHSLTAVFTAANPASFGPSMPPPVSLTVIGLF